MSAKAVQTISRRIFRLTSLLFFVSGATGLAYQIIWFRRFSHVWGSSSLAFAAVGGSFLLGLGLGAYGIGRFSDRLARPLRWYGRAELAIGVLALLIPFEITAMVNASVGLYAYIPEAIVLRYLVQSCLTLLVIGPSCVLMGGTLPLLIRQLTTREGSLDQATGWLYALNTFGAAVGCYLTGFHLLPWLGLLWTNNLAAMVNIAIGLISIQASRTAASLTPTKAAPVASTASPWNWPLAGPYLAAALAGCAALILEMTWTRQLTLVLGGSTYALTATLFVVLFGIGLGSLLFHVFRGAASRPGLPVVVVGILLLSTLAGKLCLPSLAVWVSPAAVQQWRADPSGNALVCIAVSAALELIPALAMGFLFPLFVHLTHASAKQVGAAVGNIYAWNTLGSIVGANLTAVLLFPQIGTAGCMALAAGLYLVALLAILSWRGWPQLATGAAIAAAGAAVMMLLGQPIDPRLTNMGFYLYGDPRLVDKDYPNSPSFSAIIPRFLREGPSCNVFVSGDKSQKLDLRLNGKVDAGNGSDMVTQLGLAYFPRMFKPDAKEVLVIGFGSGCTSGRSLLFPGTRVTCCEIEPAVYEAAEQFGAVNLRPHEKSRDWLEARNAKLPVDERLTPAEIDAQARFSIILGDGRTAIQGSHRKYDLIISEPSNPWLAGVSNLFTQEFFHSAREHLTAGGVLAQWIQTYNFTLEDYLMIVRTLRSEFPHYGVVTLLGGVDTVLLASNKPLIPTATDIAALQTIVNGTPAISADFNTWLGGSELPWVLLQNYQLGEDQLNRLVDSDPSGAINSDLQLQLEFDAPLHLFRNLEQRETAAAGLRAAMDAQWTQRLAEIFQLQRESAIFNLTLGDYLYRQLANPLLARSLREAGQLDAAAILYQSAVRAEPTLFEAHRGLARICLMQGRPAAAVATWQELLRLTPNDPQANAALALQYLIQKNPAEASFYYREALRLKPHLALDDHSYLWANNLAWMLATHRDPRLRNGAEAVHWAQQACEVDGYQQPDLMNTLAAAYAESGKFDEAIELSEKVIHSPSTQANLAKRVARYLRLYRASQPLRE